MTNQDESDLERADYEELLDEFFVKTRRWLESNPRGERDDHRLVPFPVLVPWRRSQASQEALVRIEAALDELRKASQPAALNCPLARDHSGGAGGLEMLVAPSGAPANRVDAIRELRDFTSGAEKLVIVDPYAYGGKEAEATAYVDELARAARLSGSVLRSLHVIYSARKGNTNAIKKELAARAYAAQVQLTDHDTDEIHDRVWLADAKRGLVVGTSFGGIGSRAAFLLPLPNADFTHIWEYLQSKGFLDGEVRRPKQPTKLKRSRR